VPPAARVQHASQATHCENTNPGILCLPREHVCTEATRGLLQEAGQHLGICVRTSFNRSLVLARRSPGNLDQILQGTLFRALRLLHLICLRCAIRRCALVALPRLHMITALLPRTLRPCFARVIFGSPCHVQRHLPRQLSRKSDPHLWNTQDDCSAFQVLAIFRLPLSRAPHGHTRTMHSTFVLLC
jgi:hypothetical protein